MTLFGPIVPPAGPCPARIAIVAEAPGTEESDALKPLVGASGRELRRMLRTVGVNLDDCFKTNVFSRQPPGNNIGLYGTANPSAESRRLGPLTNNPVLYCADAHLAELDRLRAELILAKPNVVLALGNTASWALVHSIGINSIRGTFTPSDFLGPSHPPLKVLPSFHPAAILRQWDMRTILIQDLEKAVADSHTPHISYDNTELWLAPDLADLETFGRLHLASATQVATDVETKRGQITCVSFAPRPDISICVPFWAKSGDPNYWRTVEEELTAWKWVRHWCEKPDLVKITQNGLYDIQYFIPHGISPINFSDDTMLAHHSLYSELRKGLGFLGSVYANRPGWKDMRTAKKEELLKRDD